MSRRTVSSFWNEQASETVPGNASSIAATISCALSASQSRSGSVAGKEHLPQGVAPEPAAQRLERDHLVGRDVAEVDRRAELLDEPGLCGLRRRLEDDVERADGARDLADQLGAHAAVGVEDPGGAALACLGDDLPRAGGELLAEPLRPLLGRV